MSEKGRRGWEEREDGETAQKGYFPYKDGL